MSVQIANHNATPVAYALRGLYGIICEVYPNVYLVPYRLVECDTYEQLVSLCPEV